MQLVLKFNQVVLLSFYFCRTIMMEKLAVTEITCTFELQNYPFDNQECFLIFVNKGSNGDIVQLITSLKVAYNGAPSFLNYVIENPEMLDTRGTSLKNDGNIIETCL